MLDPAASPYAPIQGTERPPHGLFIDRWGTLLAHVPTAPCLRFEPALLAPGAVEALFRAGQSGWTLYLIGNEDAGAFGRRPDEHWSRFERGLLAYLDGLGVPIAKNYACLERAGGRGRHAAPSVFQLPNTGAFYHAHQFDGIRLEDSWVIGDSYLELVAGDRAGCRLAAVAPDRRFGSGAIHVEPELVAASLVEAIDTVLAA